MRPDRLRNSTQLMIEHHQQAVDMAKYADANASHQEIKDLAKQIIEAHGGKIELESESGEGTRVRVIF